jgi:integrase
MLKGGKGVGMENGNKASRGCVMIWRKSEFPGVRYYEHDERKHGVRKDRNFYIRYKWQGKTYEEAVGWASQGNTARSVYDLLSELKRNQKAGVPPYTLAEKRAIAEQEQQQAMAAADLERAAQERQSATLEQFFLSDYLPSIEGACSPETVRKSREHVKNWLAPALGDTPLPSITSAHLEKVRQSMLKAGKSARTMEYVFATFRAIWNLAQERELVAGRNPVKGVKLPKVDNMRQRYLKSHEADMLLDALLARSPITHHLTLISLHTGMRFSEVVGLTWGAVDIERKQLHILRTKGKKARTVHMTGPVHDLLSSLPRGNDGDLVFSSNTGERIGKVSRTFDLVVDELGFNNGITDPKGRFTFHCLRHTHASWMIENGVQLYLVQKQLGHSTPVVTQRYAHVSDQQLAEATQAFEKGLEKKAAGKIIPLRPVVNQ